MSVYSDNMDSYLSKGVYLCQSRMPDKEQNMLSNGIKSSHSLSLFLYLYALSTVHIRYTECYKED